MFRGNIHRHLLILSLANWAIAIVCWTISAYLGTTAPTGIFVYTVLFVIGLFAVVVAVGSFVLADFGTEPVRPAVATGVADGDGAPGPVEASAKKPAAKPADKPAAKAAEKPAEKPAEKTAEKPAEKTAEKPADKPAEEPAAKPAGKPAAEPAGPGA